MKNQCNVKASILLFRQKLLSIQNFYYLLKCYLEKLPGWILVILIKNVSKGDFEIALIHHLISKISDKNLSREEVKALNNLVKNKDLVIQKADKAGILLFLTEVTISQKE